MYFCHVLPLNEAGHNISFAQFLRRIGTSKEEDEQSEGDRNTVSFSPTIQRVCAIAQTVHSIVGACSKPVGDMVEVCAFSCIQCFFKCGASKARVLEGSSEQRSRECILAHVEGNELVLTT